MSFFQVLHDGDTIGTCTLTDTATVTGRSAMSCVNIGIKFTGIKLVSVVFVIHPEALDIWNPDAFGAGGHTGLTEAAIVICGQGSVIFQKFFMHRCILTIDGFTVVNDFLSLI